ncbi:MAG: MopE-related protein [Candidatus Woesearchaeota archaeon]|nr:MopE-related protein [Candidatus Woesearchaeota archaeon]
MKKEILIGIMILLSCQFVFSQTPNPDGVDIIYPGYYEESDSRITYDGIWITVNNPLASGGFRAVTSNINANAMFRFYGDKIIIYRAIVKVDNDEYHQAELCIDSACENIYFSGADNKAISGITRDNLELKEHTVTITRKLKSINLDAIEIFGDAPSCGNGNVENGEECDDGNGYSFDGCSNDCILTFCGDSTVQGPDSEGFYEECDDGNSINTDACIINPAKNYMCKSAKCGDGYKRSSEECDDGNANNNDACIIDPAKNYLCKLAKCGDGYETAGEECDDGNANNNDACLNSCMDALCGDNLIWIGRETCDEGTLNGQPNHCSQSCQGITTPVCGNSIVEAGEECDKDNSANYLCNNLCKKTCPSSSPCGTFPTCFGKSTFYLDADKDGFGTTSSAAQACALPTGYSDKNTDCNDNDKYINPIAIELCDNIDNNCMNQADETCPCKPIGSTESCGIDTGECMKGVRTCTGLAWSSCVGEITPQAEICDYKDNDCDGNTDEDMLNSCMNYQTCQIVMTCDACENAPSEVCDNIDNDCDGPNNEGLTNCCTDNGKEISGCTDDPNCPGTSGTRTCQNFQWSSCKAVCPIELNISNFSPPEENNLNIIEEGSITVLPELRKEEYICDGYLSKTIDFAKLEQLDCQYKTNKMDSYAELHGEQQFDFYLGNNWIDIKCKNIAQKITYVINKDNNCNTSSYISDFKSIISDLVDLGIINEEEKALAEKTAEKVSENTAYSKKDNTAVVTHTITPKENMSNMEFRLYIPKECANDVKDVDFYSKNYTVINEDPIVAWHFNSVDEQIDLSYKLKGVIDDTCLEKIKGLPIEKLIKEKKKFNIKNLLLPLGLIILASVIPFALNRRADEKKDNMSEEDLIMKLRTKYLKEIKARKFQSPAQLEEYMTEFGLNDEDQKWIMERIFK